MSIKNRISVIGCGQCGSNIAHELELLDYHTLLINTSLEDLNSIKGAKHKYHIKGGEGASKKRDKAREIALQSIDDISEIINQYSTTDIILVTFSCSGGTGSSLAPVICDILSSQGKIVIVACVIPDENEESIIACDNTYKCLKELDKLDIGCTFILDNKKCSNKFSINKDFANVFDAFVSVEHSSRQGNMDNAEIMEVFSTKGNSILVKVSRDKTTTANMIDAIGNNIYAPIEKNRVVKYLGLSLAKDNVDKSDIIKEVGEPLDSFTGYGANTSHMILSGLTYPEARIKQINAKAKEKKHTISNNINSKNSSIFDDEDEEDLNDLFNKPKKKREEAPSARELLMNKYNKRD